MQNYRAAQQAQQQRLATLLKTRRWQWTALALGSLLLVLLSVLATRQLIRMRRLRLLPHVLELIAGTTAGTPGEPDVPAGAHARRM